ncbi:MAG: hypothetical protein WC916_02650 [Candidatus Woesearchaeota archaeon]
MISLRNDIYAHLALSAQKFKTPRVMTPSSKEIHPSSPSDSSRIASHSIEEKIPDNRVSSMKKSIIRTRVEKIDEKVDRLLENPQLRSLQRQLEQLTLQFNTLRANANKEDVVRIENKILLLEKLLKEKSYV